MPLSEGTSNAARQENIKREIEAGKSPKQAAAIAYSKQRENIASKASDSDVCALLDDLCEMLKCSDV